MEVHRRRSRENHLHGEEERAAQCRERRRRRMIMMRYGCSANSNPPPNPVEDSGSGSGTGAEEGSGPGPLPLLVWGPVRGGEPLYGVISVVGRSRRMEDQTSAMTNLCRPEIARGRSVHYFAVYDGHGGTHVSTLCKERMHTLVREELECIEYNQEDGNDIDDVERELKRAMIRSFWRMEHIALGPSVCGGTNLNNCTCSPSETIYCGSTAVAALLTQNHIIVANTGDSRAVLCRNGRAIPLSFDHTPDRPDERARIEAAGGRVINMAGPRVQGILSTSRAIGDRYLKPIVTWKPEITVVRREPGDECLIIATDGLWDFLPNQVACNIARVCLAHQPLRSPRVLDLNEMARSEDDDGGDSRNNSRCLMAAALLTRVAMSRRSQDNISVIVVDLKNNERLWWNSTC